MSPRFRPFVPLLLCLLATAPALAQLYESTPIDPFPAPDPAWGTTAESFVSVGSFEFQPYQNGTVLTVDFATANRYVLSSTNPTFFVTATVHLPRGAVVTGIDFVGCNTAASSLTLWLLHHPVTGGSSTVASVTVPGSSPCGAYRSATVAHTVNATTGPYVFQWVPTVYDVTQSIAAARVYYKLQVSPAPASATFADVPVGHPLRQFVEALVASGITAGCGGGNFCPDDPLTRGQMAVFLAKALGLQWAP